MKSNRRMIEIIAGVIAVIVVVILYVLVLNSYQGESSATTSSFHTGSDSDPNHLAVQAQVLGFDPIKGDVSVRLQFSPEGDLAKDQGATPANSLTFAVNSATGKSETTFDKGKRINPMDVTLSTYSGEASDYPFDNQEAELEMLVTSVVTNTDGVAEEVAVPTTLDFYGHIHGFKIDAAPSADNTDGYIATTMDISRSPSVVVFAVFGMAAILVTTIIIAFLVLSIVVRGRKIEVAMFTLTSALLFGFYAFRNSMPGTPPIGTLSDFIAFFWGEAVVAIALIVLIGTWLVRTPLK